MLVGIPSPTIHLRIGVRILMMMLAITMTTEGTAQYVYEKDMRIENTIFNTPSLLLKVIHLFVKDLMEWNGELLLGLPFVHAVFG
jgi:hypothetical protein